MIEYDLQFFAKDGPGGEKTEPATAKKLREAREKGQVAKSRDLTGGVLMLASFVVFKIYVGYLGGNLTEIFDRISETIRGRMKIERRVKTLTAQGRFQGIIVSVLPIILGIILTMLKPSMMMPFLMSAKGIIAVVVIFALITFGWLIIRKIIRIDV
jgi:flagellar biosynthetic protein FlhB